MHSLSLSRLFTLLLVIALGLIMGYSVAKFVHAAPAPAPGATTVVNIQLAALVWSLATLATGLWLLRGWIARQWSRFTAWLELTLEGLFDFESVDEVDADVRAMRGVHSGKVKLVPLRTSAEGRQPDGSYVIEVGLNETAADVVRRHPDKLYTSGGDILVKRGDPVILRSSASTLGALPQPGTPEYEACDQGALDDAVKTTCTACGKLGHWSPDCPNLGLLPCRGCSWCGKDPGNLPAAEWTECDGSGFYLPTRAQHERINVRMQRPSPQPKQNAVVSSTPETFEAKGARLKREADAWSPENSTSWPFGQCGPKPPPSTSSSNDC